MVTTRTGNPLRKIELERHKWDAHAKAPERSNTRASRTHSASDVPQRAKRALYPTAARPSAASALERSAAATGSSSCAAYDLPRGGGADLSRSQTELYAALFGQQPRQSSPTSSPRRAWADEYDAVPDDDDTHAPAGGFASPSDGAPARTNLDQAKAIERAVLKAMRGASLQRQQAVDEALSKVARERDADIAKAVQAARVQVCAAPRASWGANPSAHGLSSASAPSRLALLRSPLSPPPPLSPQQAEAIRRNPCYPLAS